MTSVAALCTAVPAYAESSPDAVEVIIVTSDALANEAEAQVRATPGGADVVTHEEYANRHVVSLKDTLAFSPGVYVQPRYGQEVRISIRGSGISRGFHMRGLTLLQDGAPINLADDNGDFQELEPIFFDHLEVYRGANALRFGSNTLGGAINGVTPTGRTAPGLYLRGDVGSFETLRGLASYGYAGDRLDAWGALAADTSSGDRQHAGRESVRFHGNTGFDVSDTVTTRFYISVNEINQELPGALTLDQVLSTPELGNFAGDQARDISSIRFQNQTTVQLGDADLSVGAFVNDKSLYHPIFQVIDQESLDQGVFGRYEWGSGPIAFTVGAEGRWGDVEAKRFVNINGDSGALTYDADQTAFTARIYAEGRVDATDKLTLIAGGLYAWGERKQFEKFNMFAGGPTGVLGKARFEEFSPRVGVLYEVQPDIQLFANLSKSAEFPGFIELAQVASFVPVEAQTAWTGEIGARGRHGIAEWDVALYSAEIDNEILQFNIGPDIPAATFNADKTRHSGIEAGLSLDLTEAITLRQIYQYSDFAFEDDAQYGNNQLPVVPEHVYRAELRISQGPFQIAPNIEWIPDGAWADYTNTTRTDGYVLAGVSASWSAADNIDLFLDARNLFDEKAAGDISATVIAAPNSRIYQPVERRALFAGVRTRF